jgi:hypothetical protein
MKYSTRQTVGTDIHTLWELVRNDTFVTLEGEGPLRQQLLEAPRSFTMRSSGPWLTWYSQTVKASRRRLGHAGHR